jgi:hypothetical protein
MRKWVKFTIAGAIVACLGFAVLAGTGAYFVFRHLDTRPGTEADTLREFEALRAKYAGRPPLVEIINPEAGDIRINRTKHPEGQRATTIHVLTWNDGGERFKTDVPLWLMRFSSLNIASHLGIAPARFRLTVEDVARYGPGIVAEVRQPGRSVVMIWVE